MNKAVLVSLLNTLIITFIVLLHYLGQVEIGPWFSNGVHKFWHVVAAILFLGNIIVGPIWVSVAFMSRNEANLKFAFRMLLLTDLLITIPSYDVTIVNGLILGQSYGGYEQAWINHTIYNLLAFSILVIPVVFVQGKIDSLIKAGHLFGRPMQRLFVWWMILGGISFIPIAHIVYSMLFKGA